MLYSARVLADIRPVQTSRRSGGHGRAPRIQRIGPGSDLVAIADTVAVAGQRVRADRPFLRIGQAVAIEVPVELLRVGILRVGDLRVGFLRVGFLRVGV